MKTITKRYIDGVFVESHGHEAMDSINPSNGKAIARTMLADEEDARRAIAPAKRAFASFSRSPKEERANVLRRLHEVLVPRVTALVWPNESNMETSS
jgi:aldehyde dehydrogenase (NAD+)